MYGLNGAPAIWQRYVDGLFQSMDGVKVFMDDARITGSDEISHLTALEEFFKKCREHGLNLNLNKNFLSRLPKTSEELEVKDDITIFQMSQIEALPVTSKELRQETSKDIELGPLLRALRKVKICKGGKPSIPLRMVVCTDKGSVFQGNFGRTFWKNYMLDT
ncbi:uncharacterized protein K02A2.6 [Trichonephila clavipes]|nr:uncharacterized protein K02A2.6 [Trichonephila clavipes]